ncbi:MAG: murein biosynthesis integral membrane protein MurJ [Desulfovibrionaceae bacterium]|jgi:putative peptidoglycan lipid II flippase|nr:murein biosynthesis integral membrane protein MurJ [Desulfovibrionaceae bacterium]
MSLLKSRQTMGVAAAVLAGSVLLSRLMGLVRDKVISYHYGATLESDVYFASFVVPDFINYLLAGGYFAITLIPLLAAYFEDDPRDGERFFRTVVTWVGLASAALTAAAMFLAPELARVAAPGFGPEATARLAHFLRIILPAQVFFLLGSCYTALLYMRRQFTVPALTPLVYNGCIIGCGLLMIRSGMEGFCWGVLAGSALGNFLMPVLAARGGDEYRVRYAPRLRHPGLKRFVLLALPLMIGQSVVVLDEQLLRVFGSLAEHGAVSWLNYARRVMLVPVGVVAQAAGVASYPFLARLAARGETGEFDRTVNAALVNTTALLVPMAAWMVTAAEPVIRLIFEQGRFAGADTGRTALALRIMLAAVFCWGVHQLVARAFYAVKDTLTPAVVGTLATLACLPLYWGLVRWLGAMGVAVASSLSVGLYTLALSVVWRRRHGGGPFLGLGRTLAACAVVSVPACAASYASARWLGGLWPAHALLAALAAIAGSGMVFVAVYLLLARLFAPTAAGPILAFAARLRARLTRAA